MHHDEFFPNPHAAAPAIAAIPASEQGYILLVAIFFLALLVLSLAAAAPSVAKSIQRDRELETFHRGMQYRRAIQLYYRKFHSYPPNVDALVKTNNIRFLRKKYIDPMTGKDDWKPVLYGQNKTPTAMGFFGQPLSGTPRRSRAPAPAAAMASAETDWLGGHFDLAAVQLPLRLPSSGSSSNFGRQAPAARLQLTDNSAATAGTAATQRHAVAAPIGKHQLSGHRFWKTGTGSGLTGQTFGGAGIIGFSPASPKQSILVYKKKNHYNEWEFTYDPLSDMPTVSGGNTGAIGQPASSTTTPRGHAQARQPHTSGSTRPAPSPPSIDASSHARDH